MNGRDFLGVARRLASGPEEADWRSAVSRAYYAAFHVGCELLAGLRFGVPQADRAHSFVYVRLNNCGDPAAVKAGATLFDLRRNRNRADYAIRTRFPATMAVQAVGDAELVIQTLDGLSRASLTRITDAIKLYERQVGDLTWHP
jgi:uncharacterized protein (UPF0332 family)